MTPWFRQEGKGGVVAWVLLWLSLLDVCPQEKECPVKRERLSESSPAFRILAVEPRYGQTRRDKPPPGVAGTCAQRTDTVQWKSRTTFLPSVLTLPFPLFLKPSVPQPYIPVCVRVRFPSTAPLVASSFLCSSLSPAHSLSHLGPFPLVSEKPSALDHPVRHCIPTYFFCQNSY